jgi:hypothetical protein
MSRTADDTPDSTTLIVSTPYDPMGEVSLFGAHGAPSLSESAEAVFNYVDRKAREAGTHVKLNRGVPPGADPANMLTVEEKAIVILGRALGLVWEEISGRINELRMAEGRDLMTRPPHALANRIFKGHTAIVEAIQADILESTEAFSPLVSGQQRFVWRARMVQLYREQIERVFMMSEDTIRGYRRVKGGEEEAIYIDKVDEIRKLDRAMQPHMNFFDRVGVSGDISALLSNPSDRIREQAATKREVEIELAFERNEITDEERIDQLRDLRHGASE